jgi:AraC-like DNA-binding protein
VRFASPLVTIMTVDCDLPRSGPSSSMHVEHTWIGLPLSGVFTLHARGGEQVVHSALAVVFPERTEYRMSHPTDDGDTNIALGFADGVVEEALPADLQGLRVTQLDLRMRYIVGLLLAATDRTTDRLQIDNLALHLLRLVADNIAPAPECSATASASARVDQVRATLAERPEAHWTLESLGDLVGYSPFHLAHQFRAHTGTSVHRYLTDLRAAAALARIEAGETSLAAVAADLGFAHHSHLTATLRRRLGLTPRMIRERLGRSLH